MRRSGRVEKSRLRRDVEKRGFAARQKCRGAARLKTRHGAALGRAIVGRHESLAEFLRLIGVRDARTIWRDVEGIEHHVSPATMSAIRGLVRFFEANPGALAKLAAFRRRAR